MQVVFEGLGRQFTDSFTGFSGKASAICYYASGRDPRLCLEAMVEGKVVEHWVDLSRIFVGGEATQPEQGK